MTEGGHDASALCGQAMFAAMGSAPADSDLFGAMARATKLSQIVTVSLRAPMGAPRHSRDTNLPGS